MVRVDTVVVGAGAAGLAAARRLRDTGRPFVVLDAGARVGDSWRERYDCLRLFTPARFCALPGRPLPLAPTAHPTKDDIADYLEVYATSLDLPIIADHVVTAHRFTAGRHRLDDAFEALHLIVATGAFRRPSTPPFAVALSPSIRQLHSSRYLRPADLMPGPTLVVGAGTAGADIALDVAAQHRTWLSGPSTGHLPLAVVRSPAVRRLYNLPVPPGRTVRRLLLSRGSPLTWQNESDLRRAGIERVPRTIGTRDGYPVLTDGRIVKVANVVWCTGYHPDYRWLDPAAIGPDGRPHHRHGVSTTLPRLGFVGLPFQHTFASGFLGGMATDAARVIKPSS